MKGNGAVHKGMPHKFYHGKTGVVWNVTKRAVGVEVNKLVGNRIIAKRIHVRVEHVNHSKSRQEFLDRAKRNKEIRAKAKAEGVKYDVKRQMPGPRPAVFIKPKKITTLNALTYTGIGH